MKLNIIGSMGRSGTTILQIIIVSILKLNGFSVNECVSEKPTIVENVDYNVIKIHNPNEKILKITDIVRINGSHNSIKWHESISKKIKKINLNSKILLDIPGVKQRTKNTSSIKIKKNQNVTFSFDKKKNKNNKLIILYTNKIQKKITK